MFGLKCWGKASYFSLSTRYHVAVNRIGRSATGQSLHQIHLCLLSLLLAPTVKFSHIHKFPAFLISLSLYHLLPSSTYLRTLLDLSATYHISS